MSDIRKRLNHAAGPDEPPIDLDALRRRANNRRQRRRLAVAGLGAAAVLAVSGFLWTAGSSGPPDQQVAAGNVAGDPGLSTPVTASTTGAPTTTEPETTTITATTERPSTTGPAPTTTTGPAPTTTAMAPASSIPASTTSIPAPNSTVPVTVPSTAVPSAGGLHHLSGIHRGEGLPYEPTSGGCKEFAHRLDSVFILDTGEDWTYHADYCGEVDPIGFWTGAGTFTFTTPARDKVAGWFTSRAMLPTKGEPYDLTITGGTGPWVGVTGTCHLTNHIRPLPSGLNEQAGTFTCDIRPSAGNLP